LLLHLMRHGETAGGARYWGATDVALSWRGWRQMRAAVAGQSWDLIVSSPLRRCAPFAEALARELNVPCRQEADLREMSFGDWDGRSASEILKTDAERLRNFWEDPCRDSPPGGESLQGLRSRVTAACRRIVADREHRRVLLVTHAGPIRLLQAERLGTPLSNLLSIDVPHGSLITIDCLTDGSAAPVPGTSILGGTA